MRSGVKNNQRVADFYFGHCPLHGEFIAVFAQRTDDIVDAVGLCLFFAGHLYFVVGAVHARPHKVGHARVRSDVVAVNMLFVDRLCNKIAVGAGDYARAFHIQPDFFSRKQGIFFNARFVRAFNALRDKFVIDGFLLFFVRNTHAAADVDKLHIDAERLF